MPTEQGGKRIQKSNINSEWRFEPERLDLPYREESQPMAERWLAALPVYNEVNYVDGVLDEVRRYIDHVLVVDDGSSDGTSEKLAARRDVAVVHHPANRGYGAALNTAFQYAIEHGFDGVVTLDCDGQHEPKRIPRFVAAAADYDIVSGSRYLKIYEGDSEPPAARKAINQTVTREINTRLGYNLTDAFCGFKAYRTEALKKLNVRETGYAMPLELWVQAAAAKLRIIELPVPLIYLDEKRSFGGVLDNPQSRLEYYHLVIDRSIAMLGEGAISVPPVEMMPAASCSETGCSEAGS